MKYTLSVGNRRLTHIFFGNEWLTMLLLFPFFKSSGFDVIPVLSLLCNAMLMIECVLFTLLVFLEKKTNPYYLLIVCFEVWNYILAPIISGAEGPSMFYLAGGLGMMSLCLLGFSVNYKKFLKALCKMLTLMIVANFLVMLVFPEGIAKGSDEKIYLFGLRVGFPLVVIPGLMFNMIRDDLCGRRSFNTKLCFVCGLLSILFQWVATGIVELIAIAGMLFLLKGNAKIRQVKFWMIALGILVVNFLITLWSTDNAFLNTVTSLLGRDAGFTGRTDIWPEVVKSLQRSPIAGFGLNATVLVQTSLKSAHNQWLHVAMEGGYTAMILMLLAVLASCKYVSKFKKECWYNTVCACFTGLLVGCITEIQIYFPFFLTVFMMPYLLKKYVQQEVACGSKN